MAIVEFKDVSRVYTNGEHEQRALDHVNLSLEEGKFIVILGPSGAGKSTLLNMLGGLDSPTEGTIVVNGRDISTLTPNELAEYRAASVGFVFQSYNLIPTLTVIENVALVKEIAPGAGQESPHPAVRRTYRRAGLRDRRHGAQAPAVHGPRHGENDHRRDPQPEHREDGGRRDPGEERKDQKL